MKEVGFLRRKYLERHAAKGEGWAKHSLEQETRQVQEYREGARTENWYSVNVGYRVQTNLGVAYSFKYKSATVRVNHDPTSPSFKTAVRVKHCPRRSATRIT